MTLLDEALRLAALGWHVFPLREGDKRPHSVLGPTGGHHHATTDPDIIATWWHAFPTANLGIALEPSGIVVLDVDVAGDKPGRESLARIDAELPPTLVARTGRGGLHALFSRPQGVPATRKIGFLPGLDLLGKGYIVAAPSRLTDSAGTPIGVYAWLAEPGPAALSPLPPALIAPLTRNAPTAQATASDAPSQGIASGGRNDGLFRLGCMLRDQGLGEQALGAALIAENLRICRPPLDDAEVMAIAASVLRTIAHPLVDIAANQAMREGLGLQESKFKEESAAPRDPVLMRMGDVLALDLPPVRVYSTGWPLLDQKLGEGLTSSSLTIAIARTGAGKSGFALTVARYLAEQGVPQLYVSTELNRNEGAARTAAGKLRVAHRDVIRGRVDRAEAMRAIRELPIYTIGCETLVRGDEGLELIETAARAIHEAHGQWPVVWVDYLQMVAGSDDPQQVRLGVSAIAYGLQRMSVKLDIAIVGIAATGRGFYRPPKDPEDRDDPLWYLGAAKESGDIEFAASNILFLDVASKSDGEERLARIVIAKARSGDIGFVGAKFHGPSGAWEQSGEAAIVLQQDRESNAKSKSAMGDAESDAIVLRRVAEMEARGQRESKSVLCEMCEPLGEKAASRVINRLLSRGALRYERGWYMNNGIKMEKPGKGDIVLGAPATKPEVVQEVVPGSIGAVLLGKRGHE